MKVPILSIEALDRGFLLQFGEMHLACATFEEALAHVLQDIATHQPQNQVMQGPLPPKDNNVRLFPGAPTPRAAVSPDEQYEQAVSDYANGRTNINPSSGEVDDTDDEEVRYGVGPDRSMDEDATEDQEVRGGGAPDLNKQMKNLATLNTTFAAGKTKSGLDFGPNEWSKGLAKFCPDIDPTQAEYLRGQYIAQQREGSDWE